MRLLVGCVLVVLACVGAYAQGVAQGYARGKAVVTNALQPRGSVLIEGAACAFYEDGVAPPLGSHPYRVEFVNLFVPDDGR